MSYKVGMVSLGCAKNLIDSEMMLAMFDPTSFSLTDDPSEADLIIVNTCGFIASAKKESIDTIMEMAQYHAKIAVVGCLAERYYEELKGSLKEADLIVPIKDYKDLPALLEHLIGVKEGISPLDPMKRIVSTPKYSAYLRISEGCNNFCSFCAIPFIRGRFVSRPFLDILTEAKDLRQKGVKEISLISQDTTRYGFDFKDRRPNVVDLLKELDKMGFYSIRLLYLYPDEISEELIGLIASSRSIAHYFDVPVQAGSDRMLKAMKRHGDKKQIVELFKKIRERVPDAVTRTTFICGFPGESEADHQETLSFLDEMRFDHVGAFAYSREEGTAAYSYPNQINGKTKEKRLGELMDRQKKISYENNRRRIGEIMEGIVVSHDSVNGLYGLRSTWNAPDGIDGLISFTSSKKLEIGSLAKVRITGAFVYDLMGMLI